ncbi:hypothetical protein FHR81_000130 [Actinoalloteichus hoggarensis]|uniref:Uncharacterized protein n=1 Tax=Actinoalloteichus hoggarensis TaxID=1470176 RepID=A0A221W377_9PSEU|nr:hypothetical protein AHOG_12715 [Actinoalloteichus hoggarensis]MBB5919101.1 hypothetical protein [Actinoalloteichus hoggarensis]
MRLPAGTDAVASWTAAVVDGGRRRRRSRWVAASRTSGARPVGGGQDRGRQRDRWAAAESTSTDRRGTRVAASGGRPGILWDPVPDSTRPPSQGKPLATGDSPRADQSDATVSASTPSAWVTAASDPRRTAGTAHSGERPKLGGRPLSRRRHPAATRRPPRAVRPPTSVDVARQAGVAGPPPIELRDDGGRRGRRTVSTLRHGITTGHGTPTGGQAPPGAPDGPAAVSVPRRRRAEGPVSSPPGAAADGDGRARTGDGRRTRRPRGDARRQAVRCPGRTTEGEGRARRCRLRIRSRTASRS